MNFTDYQRAAHSTAIYPANRAMEYLCLGLASEAGEVAGVWKKVLRDAAEMTGNTVDESLAKLIKESGDVLWYIAELCTATGVSMEDVAAQNIAKLKSRMERGVIAGSGDNR